MKKIYFLFSILILLQKCTVIGIVYDDATETIGKKVEPPFENLYYNHILTIKLKNGDEIKGLFEKNDIDQQKLTIRKVNFSSTKTFRYQDIQTLYTNGRLEDQPMSMERVGGFADLATLVIFLILINGKRANTVK